MVAGVLARGLRQRYTNAFFFAVRRQAWRTGVWLRFVFWEWTPRWQRWLRTFGMHWHSPPADGACLAQRSDGAIAVAEAPHQADFATTSSLGPAGPEPASDGEGIQGFMLPAEYERRLVRQLLARYGPGNGTSKTTVLSAWVEGNYPESQVCVRYFNHVDSYQDEECFPLYVGELSEHFTADGATPGYAAFWLLHLMIEE